MTLKRKQQNESHLFANDRKETLNLELSTLLNVRSLYEEITFTQGKQTRKLCCFLRDSF